MVRKIRFPLEMANGVKVRTLEELRDNFDLDNILGYFLNGKLMSWLEDRYYENECEKLGKLCKNDNELYPKLCGILGVEYQVKEVNLENIEMRNQKIAKLKQYTDDKTILDKVDIVAFNQEELADLIDNGEPIIYLYENQFTIPLKVLNIHYIGIGRVFAVINSTEIVDFAAKGIVFTNILFNSEYLQITETTPAKILEVARNAYAGKNYTKALEYFKKAADFGISEAMNTVGRMYNNGLGIKQDYNMAMEWYLKAAELDNGKAIMNLADLFYNKKGDYTIARNWYDKAAQLGFHRAMRILGDIYLYGKGVEEDAGTALEWYKLAIDSGNNSIAISRIGDMYYYGKGQAVDYQTAYSWYKKAADLENAWSIYVLGWMYEFGQGVNKNIHSAQEYYKKASDLGYRDDNFKFDPTYRYGRNLVLFYNGLSEGREWFRGKYSAQALIKHIDATITEMRKLTKIQVQLPYVNLSAFNLSKSEINAKFTNDIRNANKELENKFKRMNLEYVDLLKNRFEHYILAITMVGNSDPSVFNNKDSYMAEIENQILYNQLSIPDLTDIIINSVELMDTSSEGFFGKRTYMVENWDKLQDIYKEETKVIVEEHCENMYHFVQTVVNGWSDELERIKRFV